MVAIIGYPGSSNHTWKRFDNKKAAVKWLSERGQRMFEGSGRTYSDALTSQRVISEKDAAQVRYCDGMKCYPVEPPVYI